VNKNDSMSNVEKSREELIIELDDLKKNYEILKASFDRITTNKEPIPSGTLADKSKLNFFIEEKCDSISDKLLESEARFQAINENSTAGIYIVENERFGYVNRALCDMFGYCQEELIGQSPEIIIHPSDRDLFLENIRRRSSGEISSVRYEVSGLCKSGETKNLLILGGIIPIGDRRIPIGNILDITENRNNAEKLFRSNRLFAVISQVNQAIVHVKEKDRLFQEICHVIVNFGKFSMAWIGLIDDKTMEIKPIACAGNENGYLSVIRPISVSDIPEGRGPTGSAIRSDRYCICQDFNSDPLFEPWRSEAIKRGYRSSIALPIKQSGKIVGAITIYTSEINFFDEPEIKLLLEVIGDINFALDTLELELQHRQTILKLEDREKQLRLLFENMTSGFLLFEVLTDADGNPVDHRLIDANAVIEQQLSLRRNEEIGKLSSELSFHIPDSITRRLYQVAFTGEPIYYERFNEWTNRFYDVRVFSPYKGQFALLLDDVTQRKLAEEQLLKSKALLRSVVDSNTDLVWIVDANSFSLIDWNPTFEKYTLERGLHLKAGDSVRDFFQNDFSSIDLWAEYLMKAKTIGSYTVEHVSREINQIFLVTLNLLKQGNDVFGISVFAKDITQMRAIEAEAVKNKQHFQTMFENAPLGMALVDSITGQFYEVNEKFAKITGRTKETLPTLDWIKITHPDVLAENLESMRKLNAREIDGFTNERCYRKSDGTALWLKLMIVPIRREDHSHSMHLCMLEDITERKTNEEQIMILSRAVEQSQMSVVMTNQFGTIEFVNSKFCQITGYSKEEAIGQNLRILKSGQTSPEEYKNLWDTITSGKDWNGEFVNVKKNGELYVESASITPIANEKGQFTHFLAIKNDITEQKKIASQLKTLSTVVEENPLMVLITNEKYEIEYVNKQFVNFTQYAIDEIKGKISWVFNPKHGEKECYTRMLEVLNKGEVWQIESTNRKKDGKIFQEKVKIFPLLNQEKRITNYIIISEDVTREKKMLNDLVNAKEQAERSESNLKRAQIELQRSEKFLKDIETISRTGGWEYIIQTGQSFWTPEVYRIHEIDPDLNINYFTFCLSCFLPEDRKIIETAFNQCVKEGIGYDLELPFITYKGNKRWVRAKAQAIIENNELTRAIGSFTDITDHKRIENELIRAKEKSEQNENRLKLAITAGQYGVWDWETATNIMHWNDRMFELYGVSPDADLSDAKVWTMTIHPEDRHRVLDAIEKAFKKGGEFSTLYRSLHPDGKILYLTASSNVIRDEKGNPTRIIGIVQDITERKLAEIALQESEERYRNLFQRSHAILLLIDSETGAIVEANPAACNYYGWSRTQLLSMKTHEINMLDEEQVKEEMELAIIENRNYFIFKHRLANGTIRFVEVYNSPLIASGRKLLYSIVHDITDRKKTEEDLIVAKAKAEESDRLKSAFLANMSHEIRTPLNSIVGFSDLLLDPFYDKYQQSDFVSVIKQSVNNLQTIISDIMDISQIESGLITIRRKSFSIEKFLNGIVRELSLSCKQKGLELRLNKPEDDIYLYSDEGRINQIMTNLINNAIKFTENGYVEIGCQSVNSNTVLFFVKDTGIGIPSEYQEKIYERFRQIESSLSRKYGGNGLGLTICKQLAELLGGKIWVESGIGKGSTFYFTVAHS
jgi:PAS domain S-box-containing protein